MQSMGTLYNGLRWCHRQDSTGCFQSDPTTQRPSTPDFGSSKTAGMHIQIGLPIGCYFPETCNIFHLAYTGRFASLVLLSGNKSHAGS